MNFVVFNGLGLVLNIVAYYLLDIGLDYPTDDVFILGIVVGAYSLLFHFHFWAPLRHFIAALGYCIFIALFMVNNAFGIIFLLGAMLLHFKFWFWTFVIITGIRYMASVIMAK